MVYKFNLEKNNLCWWPPALLQYGPAALRLSHDDLLGSCWSHHFPEGSFPLFLRLALLFRYPIMFLLRGFLLFWWSTKKGCIRSPFFRSCKKKFCYGILPNCFLKGLLLHFHKQYMSVWSPQIPTRAFIFAYLLGALIGGPSLLLPEAEHLEFMCLPFGVAPLWIVSSYPRPFCFYSAVCVFLLSICKDGLCSSGLARLFICHICKYESCFHFVKGVFP